MKAIDLFVNPNFASDNADSQVTQEVNERLFKRGDDFFQDCTIEGLLADMDLGGIEHAVLNVDPENPPSRVLEFSRRHPDRFSLCALVDLKHLMDAFWAVEDLVKTEHVTLARVMPSLFEKAPTHPHFYPLYAKCVELDLPLSIFTGMPGPLLPSEYQDPIHLDRVCLDFPTLKLIMTHGADPWWSTAIRLMLKYQNLYMMTSAWKPKYLPNELIEFMNSRGQDKVMWASDHPVLDMVECLGGVSELSGKLKPEVLEGYLRGNADRVLFAERNPR